MLWPRASITINKNQDDHKSKGETLNMKKFLGICITLCLLMSMLAIPHWLRK